MKTYEYLIGYESYKTKSIHKAKQSNALLTLAQTGRTSFGAARRLRESPQEDPTRLALQSPPQFYLRRGRRQQRHLQGRRRQPAGVQDTRAGAKVRSGRDRGLGHRLRRERRPRSVRERGALHGLDRQTVDGERSRCQLLQI